MNTKYTKRVVLIVPIVILSIYFFLWNPITFGLCKNVISGQNIETYCADDSILSSNVPEVVYALSFFLSFPLLLLSLITYRLHDSVFRAWWNFARWMVPIIIIATLWLNKIDSGSGLGSGIFTTWVLLLLYSIFITTSLWKIVSAYNITKTNK